MLSRYFGIVAFNSGDDKMGDVYVPNITRGIAIPNQFKTQHQYYLDYTIKDSDKIDVLSQKVYGTPSYWFLIALMNDMYDFRESWPLNDEEFEVMLKQKYPLCDIDDILFYKSADGFITDPYAVARHTGEAIENVIGSRGLEPVTIGTYETEVNNRKRAIKLIDPNFVSNVVNILEAQFQDVKN